MLKKKLKYVFLKIGQKRILSFLQSPVLQNILLVGFVTVLTKGLGFFKETLVAASFGLSEVLDTFYIAILIPGFISTVFLNAFGSVFIPNYVKESNTENNIGSFQTTGLIITLGISIFFIIIAVLFTDTYLEVFFNGHTEAYYHLIKLQFYYILPCIVFWGLTSLLNGLLNINNEFKYSSLSAMFAPLSVMVCLWFFKDTFGESVLAIGTLVGSLLSFLFILGVSLWKRLIKLGRPNFKNINIKIMFKQIPAKVSSGFLTGLIPVTDQYFAAKLVVGSIAALNYGLKIPAFFTGLIIIALGNVLLPHFSKIASENEALAFEKLFLILKYLFIASACAALALIFLSPFLVEFIFERGSFTSENTELVSNIQIIFLIYAPFTICGMVIVNFLTSINKNNFMALVSLIGVVLNLILDYIFMKYYGIYGIALCTACVFIIRALILFKYTLNLKKLSKVSL